MILASATPLPLILSATAALAYVVPAMLLHRISVRTAHIWVGIAWVLQGTLLAWGLLGEPPHFGFAPALSVTGKLLVAVGFSQPMDYPQIRVNW